MEYPTFPGVQGIGYNPLHEESENDHLEKNRRLVQYRAGMFPASRSVLSAFWQVVYNALKLPRVEFILRRRFLASRARGQPFFLRMK